MLNNVSFDNDLPVFGNEEREMEKINLEHISRLEIPIRLDPQTATFSDVVLHAHFRQRKSLKYAQISINIAGNTMVNHTVPVDFQNPNFENFIRHMDYREQIEEASPATLKREWNIMRIFLTAFGIANGPGTEWDYKPPSVPPPKPRTILLPDQVHQLIHTKFTNQKIKNNPYAQKLPCYYLATAFLLGPRNPSELINLQTTDINWEKGIITITETKKHNKKRVIVPPERLLHDKRFKSLANWVDHWRPKIENQHSKDYLFLRHTDGTPMSTEQITQYLCRLIKPIFPEFQMYSTRHWCATGMLIKEKLDTKHWNKFKVGRWLGHEREDTTTTYVRYAEEYMKLAPYDWFKRVLKNHKKVAGENTLKSRNGQKTLVSNGNPSERSENSEQYITDQREKINSRNGLFLTVLNFQPISKPSLFSFFFIFTTSIERGNPPVFYVITIFSPLNSMSNNCRDASIEIAFFEMKKSIPSPLSFILADLQCYKPLEMGSNKCIPILPSAVVPISNSPMMKRDSNDDFEDFFQISPHHLHFPLRLLIKDITYNNVCQKDYILKKCDLDIYTLISSSMYVMLCYVICFLSIYLYSYLLKSLYINFFAYHTVCYVIQRGE